jgi:hypothetical protein
MLLRCMCMSLMLLLHTTLESPVSSWQLTAANHDVVLHVHVPATSTSNRTPCICERLPAASCALRHKPCSCVARACSFMQPTASACATSCTKTSALLRPCDHLCTAHPAAAICEHAKHQTPRWCYRLCSICASLLPACRLYEKINGMRQTHQIRFSPAQYKQKFYSDPHIQNLGITNATIDVSSSSVCLLLALVRSDRSHLHCPGITPNSVVHLHIG